MTNALPLFGGIHPLRKKTAAAALAAGPVTGAYAHFFPSGGGTSSYLGDQITVFAGTKTNLYTATSAAFAAVSRGGGYAAAVGNEPGWWRFASFGNHVYAANGLDELQKRTNNAGNFANGPASTFVPRPRFAATVREFLVVADLSGNTGAGFADEFAWSDVDDPDWFDASNSTRPTSVAGRKRIVSSPGQFTGLVGGEYGILFKRNSIHALQFTAGSDVWRLDEISKGVGTTYPSSIVRAKDGIYFWGGDAFYRQSGLATPERVSPAALNETLLDGLNFATTAIWHTQPVTMAEEDEAMWGFQSARTGVIIWFFKNQLLAEGLLGVAYNPENGGWSHLRWSSSHPNPRAVVGLPHTLASGSDSALDRLVGFDWDGAATNWFQFSSATNYACTLRTKRVSIALDGAEHPRWVYVKGVLPQFSMGKTSGFSSSDIVSWQPPISSIKVSASNTPTFQGRLDSDGNSVNPRSETYTEADVDDYGWFPHNLAGFWWQWEITIPESDTPWTHIDGLWIRYEVAS